MVYRVTVLRRSVVAGNPGGLARGSLSAAFTTRAAFKQANGFAAAQSGLVEDQARGVLRVYSHEKARSITIADRLLIDGPGASVIVYGSIAQVQSPTRFTCNGLDAYLSGEFDGARLQFGWQDGAYAGGDNAGDILGVDSFVVSGLTRTITLANSPETPLTAGDDFRIFRKSAEWAVENVALPDAHRRHIEITVTRTIGG